MDLPCFSCGPTMEEEPLDLVQSLRSKEIEELKAIAGPDIEMRVNLDNLIDTTYDLIIATNTLWEKCKDTTQDIYFDEANRTVCISHYSYVSAKMENKTLTTHVAMQNECVGDTPDPLNDTLRHFGGERSNDEKDGIDIRRLPNYLKIFQSLTSMRNEFQAIYLQLLRKHVEEMKSLLLKVESLISQLDGSYLFMKEYICADLTSPIDCTRDSDMDLGTFDAYGADFNETWNLTEKQEWRKLLKFFQFVTFATEESDNEG
mmetsp:Transcript_25564/g.55895  ORF Transcript_25564/g.55895 Transcript_25564/m.55895 type:complete len:260 (-) Transcript_25564:51-830(-)